MGIHIICGHKEQKCVRCGYFFKRGFIFLGRGALVLLSHPSWQPEWKCRVSIRLWNNEKLQCRCQASSQSLRNCVWFQSWNRNWAGSLEERGPEWTGPVGRCSIRTGGSNSPRQACSHGWRTFSATREKRMLRVRKLRTFRGLKGCPGDPSEVRRKGSRWSQKPSRPYTMKSVTYQHVMGENKLTGVSEQASGFL